MFCSRGFFASKVVQPVLTNRTVMDANAGTGPATASIRFRNDGVLEPHWGEVDGQWLSGQVDPSQAAEYELVVAITSGSFSAGSAGTYSLGTSRFFAVTIGANAGTKTCVFTAQIRRIADSLVMASASITLTAQSSNA